MTVATTATLVYLVTTLAATVIVGHTLHYHGRPFLQDVFAGDLRLADAVNHLLLAGFYLLNLALPLLLLREPVRVRAWVDSVELFSRLGGIVLLILGTMHFVNVGTLEGIRTLVRRHRSQ